LSWASSDELRDHRPLRPVSSPQVHWAGNVEGFAGFTGLQIRVWSTQRRTDPDKLLHSVRVSEVVRCFCLSICDERTNLVFVGTDLAEQVSEHFEAIVPPELPPACPKALQRAPAPGMVLTMPSTDDRDPNGKQRRRRTLAPGDRFATGFWTGFWTERVTFRRPQTNARKPCKHGIERLHGPENGARLGQGDLPEGR
jgi:hypothetical protein